MSLRGKEQGIKKIINLTVQGIHHTTHLQAPSAEAVDQRTLPIVWGWTVLKEKRDVKKVNIIRSLIKSQPYSVKNTLVDVKISE